MHQGQKFYSNVYFRSHLDGKIWAQNKRPVLKGATQQLYILGNLRVTRRTGRSVKTTRVKSKVETETQYDKPQAAGICLSRKV